MPERDSLPVTSARSSVVRHQLNREHANPNAARPLPPAPTMPAQNPGADARLCAIPLRPAVVRLFLAARTPTGSAPARFRDRASKLAARSTSPDRTLPVESESALLKPAPR